MGGDFYDAVPIEDGWMLVVGDVAGRGAEAASLTAMARYTLRATGQSVGSPLAALEQLNRELLERPGTALCTVACVVLGEDADGVYADIVCAGHPLPLLVREGRVDPVGSWGPLLGAFADERWRATRVPIAADDVLVLYTDGVLDAKGAEDRFGEDRLREALDGQRGGRRGGRRGRPCAGGLAGGRPGGRHRRARRPARARPGPGRHGSADYLDAPGRRDQEHGAAARGRACPPGDGRAAASRRSGTAPCGARSAAASRSRGRR